MSEVKIVATLTPFPEHIDTIRKAAQAMVPLTHQEAGCLQYDLHESRAIPMFASWRTKVPSHLCLLSAGNRNRIW